MNKLLILLIIVLGSLAIVPFETGSAFSDGSDTIKHLVPEKKYEEETKIVTELLERYHYRKQPLNGKSRKFGVVCSAFEKSDWTMIFSSLAAIRCWRSRCRS